MFNWLKNLNKDKSEDYYRAFLEADSNFKRATTKGKFIGQLKVHHRELVYTADYVGGIPESPTGKENINICATPKGLLLSGLVVGDMIPWDEIKGVDFRTQEQIRRDVTLTRMVAFGWYALALKKRRKSTVSYTVLKCERNGMPYKVVFGGNASLYTCIYTLLSNENYKECI